MEPVDPQRNEPSRLLSIAESAHFLGLTPRTVQSLISRGLIKPVRLAGIRRTLIDRRSLEELVEAAKPE